MSDAFLHYSIRASVSVLFAAVVKTIAYDTSCAIKWKRGSCYRLAVTNRKCLMSVLLALKERLCRYA